MKGCTIIYVAVDGMAAGYLALSDTVRKESPDMIDRLTEEKVHPVLLTGDHESAASAIAGQLHIQEVHANCLPEDKLNGIERACTYLEQNYLKTYEIAYRVGFRDEKYFSRVFKKVKGMSPKEYRTGKSQEQA